MPCKMQLCKQVCTLVDKKVGTGKYAISYKENQCQIDAKCVAANNACQPKLIAIMKAAAAAEAALEKATAAKNAAKGNHAKSQAASTAALKEQAAAKGALDAAQDIVDATTSAAAAAKAKYGKDSGIYKKRESEAEVALKTYQGMKKAHFAAQAAFKGSASEEMKAYKEYTAALDKHCDAEATLASLVASIGHPLKKQECKTRKIQTAATPMPCKHQLCKPICTEKQQAVSHSKYSIPFTETVCVDDTACKNANAKCSALLIGIMKAAQNAEQTLKVAHANAASAKSDHEKAKIEKAAAAAEMAEAQKGMHAAQEAFKNAEAVAASAKASKVSSQKASSAADAAMSKAVKSYDAAQKAHLKAQADFAGAKSKEAKALADFEAAVKAHCDYESIHTKLVMQLEHGHLATDNCKKFEEDEDEDFQFDELIE